MPWQSRIESEPLRRTVLAALMVGLLTGCALAAAWMSAARSDRIDPGLPTHQFNGMTVSVGAQQWLEQRASVEGGATVGTVFEERGGSGRILQIIGLPDDQPRTPLVALALAKGLLSPTTDWSEDGLVRTFDGHSMLGQVGGSLGASNGRGVVRKHLLAVVTADGTHYLAVHLAGHGSLGKSDIQTLRSIAGTVRDTRYQRIDGQRISVGPVGIALPDGLTARTGAAEAVWLAPQSAGQFYRLTIRYDPVKDLNRRLDEATDDPRGADAFTVDQWLALALGIRYRQVNGAAMSADRVEATKIGARTMVAALLRDARQSSVHHEAWAVNIEDRGVLMIEMLAEPRGVDIVRAEALRLIEGLVVDQPDR